MIETQKDEIGVGSVIDVKEVMGVNLNIRIKIEIPL